MTPSRVSVMQKLIRAVAWAWAWRAKKSPAAIPLPNRGRARPTSAPPAAGLGGGGGRGRGRGGGPRVGDLLGPRGDPVVELAQRLDAVVHRLGQDRLQDIPVGSFLLSPPLRLTGQSQSRLWITRGGVAA